MKIHLRIKELSETKRIQQLEFADILKVNKNTINNWFNGKTSIDADYIPEIARILRVPIVALFNADEDLKTLCEEPEAHYNKGECENCKSKNITISTQQEIISLLKSQIEMLTK